MEIVDYLCKALLSLVLTRNVAEMYSLRRGDIDLCVALAEAERQGVLATRLLHQLFCHILTESDENQQREHECQQKADNGRGCGFDILRKLRARVVEPLGQRRVVHRAGLIDYFFIVLFGEDYLIVLDLDISDFFLLYHAHECAVVNFDYPRFYKQGRHNNIEEHDDKQRNAVIENQRLLRGLYFLHFPHLPFRLDVA